jgi:serine/threonine-protein kinase
MAHVVSALHIELGERVALKFLRREALENKELVARFGTEARAAARIRSEHVARVFDVGTLANGIPYIVMEYLQGTDLAELVRAEGRLPVSTAVGYVLQACEALANAHANGIVHRDIKPDNLFLTRHPQGVEIVKVLDFGISKLALTSLSPQAPHEFVRTMFPIGSPSYMSPEQIRDSGDVDSRTDIWSLGCVLFKLLTGAQAFDAPTLMQLGAMILEREPLPLRQFLPDAPVELAAIVQRCLEKDPSKRWQNVSQLAQALSPFSPRLGRMAADRCSFLLPGAELAEGPLEHSSREPASELPPAMSSSIRPPAFTNTLGELGALRSGFYVSRRLAIAAGAVALVLLAYAVGRSSQPLATDVPTQAAAAPVRAALPPATAQAAAPSSSGVPSNLPAAAASSDGDAARPSPAARSLKPGVKRGHLPGRRRFGRASDEAFDVGY